MIYLLTVAGCALAGGLLLDAIIHGVEVKIASHVHPMTPGLFQHLSAVALLAILGYAYLSRKRR